MQREERYGTFAARVLAAGLLAVGLVCAVSMAQEADDSSDDSGLVDPNRVELSTPKPVETKSNVRVIAPHGPAPTATTQPTTAPGEPGTWPEFTIDEPEYDFGRVVSGKPITHTFKAKNTGKSTLRILSVRAGCGCTTMAKWAETVEPGESWELPVQVRTTGYKGRQRKAVTVTTNDPRHKTVRLQLAGEIVPRFDVQPTGRVHFGRVGRDDVTTQTIKVVSSLDPPTQVRSVKVMGSDKFEASLHPLPENAGYEISVTTVPPLNIGTNLASLRLETDSPDDPYFDIRVYAQVPPRVEVSPTAVRLADPVQRRTMRTVTLRNNGETPVNVVGVTIPGDAKITAETRVPQGQEGKLCTITLTIPEGTEIPTAGIMMSILTDDKEFAKIDVPIRTVQTRMITDRYGIPERPAPRTQPASAKDK